MAQQSYVHTPKYYSQPGHCPFAAAGHRLPCLPGVWPDSTVSIRVGLPFRERLNYNQLICFYSWYPG